MGKANTQSLYAVIHITSKAIWGDDRDTYEDMLDSFYGVRSSKELSYRQKLDFIDRLKAVYDGKPQPPLKRDGLWATHAQLDKIKALKNVLGWENPSRMQGFIKRQTGKNKSVAMLTGREASKVIIGLQRIISGKNKTLYKWLNTATAELITSDWGQHKIESLKI